MTVLASTPNSRITPRQATKTADTRRVQVCKDGEAVGTKMDDFAETGGIVTANGNVKIIDADPNRTVLTLVNESDEENMYYSYTDKPDMITGQGDKAGFVLKPNASIDVESKETIYARSGCPTVRIYARMDHGVG